VRLIGNQSEKLREEENLILYLNFLGARLDELQGVVRKLGHLKNISQKSLPLNLKFFTIFQSF
jgi:hypothetical protein